MSRFFQINAADRLSLLASGTSFVSTPGSVGFWFKPNFDWNDTTADRFMWDISGGSSSAVQFRKFTDNNLYIGGVGNRIVVSAERTMRKDVWGYHLVTNDVGGNQYYYTIQDGAVALLDFVFSVWGTADDLTIGNGVGINKGADGWIRDWTSFNFQLTTQDQMLRAAYDPGSFSMSSILARYALEGGPGTERDLSLKGKHLADTSTQPSTQGPFIIDPDQRDIWRFVPGVATSPPPPPAFIQRRTRVGLGTRSGSRQVG